MIRNKEDLKKYYEELNSKAIINLDSKQIQELVFKAFNLDYNLITKLKENILDESYEIQIPEIANEEEFKKSLKKELVHSVIAVRYDSDSIIITNTINFVANKFLEDDKYNYNELLKTISDYLKCNRGIDSEIKEKGILIEMNQFKK
ncbi:MAG: hypothetical protein ACRC1T_12075 [Clostridium chrysemydis]|uniref:hypothetical protein n=1 Tax=Clostridium chrysemydis TaxID=2665504 RepID=UPI003F34190E